jgi:hypothetical protein
VYHKQIHYNTIHKLLIGMVLYTPFYFTGQNIFLSVFLSIVPKVFSLPLLKCLDVRVIRYCRSCYCTINRFVFGDTVLHLNSLIAPIACCDSGFYLGLYFSIFIYKDPQINSFGVTRRDLIPALKG